MSDNLKQELAKAKMEKAREAWEEALWCFNGDKYPATVNRIYYCMYRACLALLVFERKVPTKHTAVIGMVNQRCGTLEFNEPLSQVTIVFVVLFFYVSTIK
jgi:uncharacterized protein (UPF0332 family)